MTAHLVEAQVIGNPYVGPRTFTEQERDLFFGRSREARDLFSLVISERLVLFYAQSGAGKSSLINTSLLPLLREAGFAALPVGRVSGTPPRSLSRELDNIYTFNLIIYLDQERRPPAELAHLSLTDYLQQTRPEPEPEAGASPQARILIIDQFEEILTTNVENWQKREAFFRQLAQAINDDPLLWVLLSMREDHVASLDPYARLLPGKLRTRFYMQRLARPAALEAVEQPATKGGRPFAPGVAEKLVNNLAQIRVRGQTTESHMGEFVEPVQLQVVCYQLWENLQGRPVAEITEADLDQLGNVDTALAQFYEQVIEQTVEQTDVSEIALREWFERQIITEAGTRGLVFRGRNRTGSLPNRVVDFLANKFLLRSEVRTGGVWYELVHDRFIEPILQANRAWRYKQPLIQVAQAWSEGNRSPGLLIGDQPLREALESNWEGLGPLVRDFVMASQAALQEREAAQEAERDAQRRRELEQAQELAETRSQTAMKLRQRALWLAIFGVLALGLAVAATIFSLEAQTGRHEAEEAKAAAIIERETAVAASTAAALNAEASRKLIEDQNASVATAQTQIEATVAQASALEREKARLEEEAVAIQATLTAAVTDYGPFEEEPSNELTLISPMPSDNLVQPGLVDFTWAWRGDLEANQGFEVRVWAEGEIPTRVHSTITDNEQGRITEIEDDVYRLTVDVKNVPDPRPGAPLLWSVAVVQIRPVYADLGIQAAPAPLGIDQSPPVPSGTAVVVVPGPPSSGDAPTPTPTAQPTNTPTATPNAAALATISGQRQQLALINATQTALAAYGAAPYPAGQVVSFGGASSDFLLRNPNNERSGIAEIPVGSEVSLLEQGPGSPSYGSGIWYQVEVADPSNGAQILTGWLPKEVIERAEFNAEETVNCRPEPQGEFHDLWHLYQTRLGCPIHPSPIAGFFSEQLFEQGMMYWSQIADLYVARIGEPESIWYMVRPQEITNFDPNGPGCLVSNDDPNDGRQVPVRGIGSIWCERTEIQQGLGMALERERGVNGDAIQGFERGLILRDSTGAIFVFFSDDQRYLNVPPN